MTDLQISLIVIGGVIVAGVISYNKWQERKARKKFERVFASDHDDVLMNTETYAAPDDLSAKPVPQHASQAHQPAAHNFAASAEAPMTPSMATPSAPAAAASPYFDDDRIEPELYEKPVRRPVEDPLPVPASDMPEEPYLSLDTSVDSNYDYPSDPLGVQDNSADLGHVAASLQAAHPEQAHAAQAAVKASRQEADLPVDELVDCIIPIALELSVRGEKILPGVQNLRHVGNKAVHFVGRTSEQVWEPISYGSVYTALLAGVQLANRNHALNELEYSELVMRLREFTDSIGAEPEIPDMIDVMQTAQALHNFVLDHDVQLGVNVRSNGAPWNVSTLLAALSRQGFDRRTDGHLVMQDGEGEVLFSMSTNATGAAETTDRLTLLLDVPRVGPARDGYGAMIACARSLAMRLGGTVVDDSDQLLSDAALSDIAEQVSAFYSAMDNAQIPAGSKRALRLFS